jgi:neutral ceramidase
MHADTIGGTEYSADYPFYLSETLKKSLGTNYVSAFAAGTCGDINQINPNVKEPVKGLEVAEKLGSTLGKTVLQKVPDLSTIQKPSFAVRSETIVAPLKEVTPEKMERAREMADKVADDKTDFMTKVDIVRDLDLMEKGPLWPMEVQVFRLDKDTALVGLPCEIFVELGLSIKQQSPFKNTIVMSICNDRPSYVPTKKAFTEGSYEINNARVKPGVGEMLVETAVKLLQEAELK